MDPTACLNRMLRAWDEKDWAEVVDAADDLLHWITNGGHNPKVTADNIYVICKSMKKLAYFEMDEEEA